MRSSEQLIPELNSIVQKIKIYYIPFSNIYNIADELLCCMQLLLKISRISSDKVEKQILNQMHNFGPKAILIGQSAFVRIMQEFLEL